MRKITKMTTFEKAVKTYNCIMNDICREHLTIGTRFSEGTDEWNLRDLVSEMQYTLNIYLDPDCIYWQDAHSPEQDRWQFHEGDWLHQWKSDISRMRRFIKTYANEALKMKCKEAHCSNYD